MDVVRFSEVLNATKGKDLRAVYTVTKPDVPLSSHDWVGLFREGWVHTRQYLAFEWAPREPTDCDDIPRRRRRSVLFPASDIEDVPTDNYQLVYINRRDEVMGKSRSFSFAESSTPDSLSSATSSIECLSIPSPALSSNSSVSSIQKVFSGFEMVNTSSRSSSEEELVHVNHVDVANSLEHIDSSEDVTEKIDDAIGWDFEFDLLNTSQLALVPVHDKDRALVAVDKKSRALVKVEKNDKALVPYNPPTDRQSFMFSLGQKVHSITEEAKNETTMFDMTPISTRFFTNDTTKEMPKQDTPETSTPVKDCCHKVKKATQCRRCRHLQTRLRRTMSERDAFRAKQQALQENQQNQEKQAGIVSSRLENVMRENERLQKRQASNAEDFNDRLKKEQQNANRDTDMLKSHKKQLEEEIGELRNQNFELNDNLDNILYSLSNQGISGIKDNHGAILDLTCIPEDPARPPLSADGWKVARSKKEERLVSSLREKERHIKQLNQRCQDYQDQTQNAKKEIEELNTRLQTEKEGVENLQKKVVEMDGQLYDLKQHVIVLKDMLDKEDKRYVATVEENQKKEAMMEGQMTRLTQLLHDKSNEGKLCSRTPITNIDIPPVVTQPKQTTSSCLDDPAIISAALIPDSQLNDIEYPLVPLAGLFSHNVPSRKDTSPEKPPTKKMKKTKKLSDKKPVYYPCYEPMKAPGMAVKETPKKEDGSKFKIAAASLSSGKSQGPNSALNKKRKFPFSPPIEIKDNACSRCGMSFPVNCPQEKIEKHRALHRKVGV